MLLLDWLAVSDDRTTSRTPWAAMEKYGGENRVWGAMTSAYNGVWELSFSHIIGGPLSQPIQLNLNGHSFMGFNPNGG